MNKKIMHINYSEGTYNYFGKVYGDSYIDGVCKMAAQIGYDGIEFRGDCPKELEGTSFKDYVGQIAVAMKKYSLSETLFCISMPEAANPDKEARDVSLKNAVEKLEIVNDLCGTTLCNSTSMGIVSPIKTASISAYEYHGSIAATPEEWKWSAELYSRLGEVAQKLGVKIALETHMHFIHDTPEATVKFVNMVDSPAVGINMDYGNTVYFPKQPSVVDTIDMYGDKLFYTHLKNSVAIPGAIGRQPTSLDGGVINHRTYLIKLKEVGFDGPIGIEAPRPGDRVLFAKQDFEYFDSLYKQIYNV